MTKFNLYVSALLVSGGLVAILNCCGSVTHLGDATQQATSTPSPTTLPLPQRTSEPLKYLAAVPGAPGTLAYLSVKPPQSRVPQAVPYELILRKVRENTLQVLEERHLIMPPIAEIVYEPQFMPNGKSVLLKIGWPYEADGEYKIHLWDRAQRKLGTSLFQYAGLSTASPSPDSAYLSVTPGDIHIVRIKTHRSRAIVRDPLSTAQAWTSRNTLLYLAQPKGAPRSSTRASIFEVAAQGGAPREVIRDAYGVNALSIFHPHPAPSPDGRWIAFAGRLPHQSSDLNEYGEETGIGIKLGVYLFDRRTHKRILIPNTIVTEEDFARWTPDSKRLLVLSRTEQQAKNRNQARIDAITIPNLATKQLAALHAQDIEEARGTRSQSDPQFQLMQVSRSGRYLFLKTNEMTSLEDMSYVVSNSIYAVNLQTGGASLLARTESHAGSSIGLDWLDESKP